MTASKKHREQTKMFWSNKYQATTHLGGDYKKK
jgi:hypothetical protein